MRRIRILMGLIISDIGGIIINSIPMFLILSLTNFFAGETAGVHPLAIALILLVSLSLFLIPFQLMIIAFRMFNIILDKYGVFSLAISGGLIGGSLFYFLILSHFSLNWANILNYALLGVLQSIIVQFIYQFIPDHWKVQSFE
jgi:hypothetical protein